MRGCRHAILSSFVQSSICLSQQTAPRRRPGQMGQPYTSHNFPARDTVQNQSLDRVCPVCKLRSCDYLSSREVPLLSIRTVSALLLSAPPPPPPPTSPPLPYMPWPCLFPAISPPLVCFHYLSSLCLFPLSVLACLFLPISPAQVCFPYQSSLCLFPLSLLPLFVFP